MQNPWYETFGSEEYKHLYFSCAQHIENAVKNISDAIFQLSRQQSLLIEEAYGTKHPLHNCAVTVAQYTQYLLNKPK